jgi:hypothetical protein
LGKPILYLTGAHDYRGGGDPRTCGQAHRRL